MFYKGYRYFVFLIIILVCFIAGFIIQKQYLGKQLTELERIEKTLHSSLLENKLEDLPDNYFDTVMLETDHQLYSVIDSIFIASMQPLKNNTQPDYIITNNNDSILYRSCENCIKLNSKNFKKLYVEIAKFKIHKDEDIIFRTYNKYGGQNKILLLFFTLQWVLFGLVFLGYIVYIWEKQRRMQKIRLDVINNMTHEFKTPLTSIQLISEMIMKQGSDLKVEKLLQYAEIIHHEADKLLQQAKQILNTAYYDQSKIMLRKRVFNIHGLIEHVVSYYTTVYKNNEISISLDLGSANPYTLVDRNHFINVLTNLLDNARKYSKNGHVNLAFRTYNDEKKLYIDVQDNGIGIDPKHQKLIFERFYRVSSGNIHEKTGYGVGLYYVKTILNMMNADIRVKSKPGEGSVFTIQMKKIRRTHKQSNNYGER